jgi:hypothetical protein
MRFGDFDWRIGGDAFPRFVMTFAANANFARKQHGLSLLARFGEATLHKK